jgi:glycosyltransferase involved in cell wall biosynthesis
LTRALNPSRFQPFVCIRENSWLHKQLSNERNDFFFLKDTHNLDVRFVWQLTKFFKRNGVDLVHLHEFFMNPHGVFAAALAGTPCVTTAHGLLGYAASKLRRRVAYRCIGRWGCLVTVSKQLASQFSEEIGVPGERIHTIYNGIPIEEFQRPNDMDRLRSEIGVAEGAPVIGMVGSLYPVKGYRYFIEAMETVKRRFPGAVFLVCGEGHLQDDLERFAAERGLNGHIKFLGFRNDVPALLQLMDVFVLSSLSEGLSLSILEAMAAGKPTVVTDVGGNRESVVDGETGFLVPPRNPEALAEKVCLLLRDRTLAERFGRNGRERIISFFSRERMVRDYEQLYLSLLEERNGRGCTQTHAD